MYGISMLKNTKCRWKKLKKIQVNGRSYHVHGLQASAELKKIPILLKLMFDTIPINSPTRTFVDTKLHYNLHGGQNNYNS